MDSHTWLEIGTCYRLGAQLDLARGLDSPPGRLLYMVAYAFSQHGGWVPKRSILKDKVHCARTNQSFTCITLAYVPLVKVSHTAKPRINV